MCRKISLVYLLFIGVVSMVLNGCAPTIIGVGAGSAAAVVTDSRGGRVVVDDQTLEHRINNVLNAQVSNGSFTIASYNQNVLLSGQVPTVEDRDKAELAVINTEGVKKVWNYLTISINENLGDITTDSYITSVAKTRLIAQKGVNANNIKVVSCAGVVYLLGGRKAGNTKQINGAIKGIKEISGVKNVINLIDNKAR